MRPNNVIVMSRALAMQASYDIDDRTVIVSISDMGQDWPEFADNPYIEDILFLNFDDVENEETGGMSQDDAIEILDFISQYAEQPLDIIVHCGAGKSRSAGTAAAIMLLLYGDDSDIFGSARYTPNMHCYRTVLDAAGFGYSDDDVYDKEETQRELWERLARENGLL